MKIIKHGKSYITFACRICGCVFQASQTEYKTYDFMRCGSRFEYYQCKCPECGLNVETKEIKYE